MTIEIPKDPSWDVPEGAFTIRLAEIQHYDRLLTGKAQDELRLVWDIMAPDHPRFAYKVGRNYKMPANGDRCASLIDDLRSWLGDGLDDLLERGRKLDLEKLKGQLADGWVVHIHNEAYAKPYVFLKAIAPKGTFTGQGLN